MDKPDRHRTAECCTDLDSEAGCRNNYFDGKRLSTDSFRVEQRYFLERRRLINRAIHGWGVVYGFAVAGKSNGLRIGSGLALDECGRELVEVEARQIGLDDLLALDEHGALTDRERAFAAADDREGVCWLLSVHYAEKSTGPVTVEDSCHCQHHEWERTCETVRYSLRLIDCDQCCREEDCELHCDCATGPCCEDNTNQRPKRGGCRCLCDHLTNLHPGAEQCCVTEVDDPCGKVKVDLRNGVPLACVRLYRDERDCRTLAEVEACGPRRLVKRNDLLFDLIQGCDLTRIIEIGWKDWHRREEPVPFDDFSAAFGAVSHEEDEYVSTLFWVKFSRPVRKDTLRRDCFAITVMSGEREGGWWQVLRVPIVRVETQAEASDPAGYVSKATVVVDGAWVEDGVRGRRSLFMGSEACVEIEVRGDFIVDCNGQTVDANAIGLSPSPTGNGTPGDTFLSTFCVAAAREGPQYQSLYASKDRVKGASS